MKFSHDVIGPDFDEADLVVFEFADAEVSFRLPEHWGKHSPTLAEQDLRDLSNFSGRSRIHPLGYGIKILLKQTWFYNDQASENHVALCNFSIQHITLLPEQIEQRIHLSEPSLSQWLMRFLRLNAVKGKEADLGTEIEAEAMRAQRKPLSIDEFEYVERKPISWPIVTVGGVGLDVPEWRAYAPLSKDSLLEITCDIGIYSSDHESISIPIAELDQLRKDMRDEILSYIRIEYSPALCDEIKQLSRGEKSAD